MLDPQGILSTDYETSSAADIRNGAWAYSQHPSTIVQCACFVYQREQGAPRQRFLWPGEGPMPPEVPRFISDGGRVLAHNCAFEQSITANRLAHLLPQPKPEQWLDTAALACAVNLPRKLEGLAKAVGASIKKDMVGHAVMKLMMVAKLLDPARGVFAADNWSYQRHPVLLRRLIAYCFTDCDATLDCYWLLPMLRGEELDLWRLDQRVNNRGVYLDLDFAAKCERLAEERRGELATETFSVSATDLANSTNTPALKAWLIEQGVQLEKRTKRNAKGVTKTSDVLDAQAVGRLLAGDALTAEARAVLNNRIEANKAVSLSKLKRVPEMAGSDGRLRHGFIFCGASTGRWTSSGLQLHNLPKDRMKEGESRLARYAMAAGDLSLLKDASDRPLAAISQALRSVLRAPPGRELIAGDYSAIEARVVAWLAGQENIVKAFQAFDAGTGEDLYVYTARSLGSKERQLGKVAVLALGYGMGTLKFVVTAAGWGVPIELKEANRIKKVWREANSKIVDYWGIVEDCAREAIYSPGTITHAGVIGFVVRQKCLLVRLPSGRCLRYYSPRIVRTTKKITTVDEAGNVVEIEMESDEIRFLQVRKDFAGMVPASTYGGKLVENITQACARDILAAGMLRTERLGYEFVAHVHDSAAAEVAKGAGDIAEFAASMAQTPDYAPGLPLAVDAYRSDVFEG